MGKKILYVNEYPHFPAASQIAATNSYDRKMELWKSYFAPRGYYYKLNGQPYASNYGGVRQKTYNLVTSLKVFLYNLKIKWNLSRVSLQLEL